MADWTGDQFTIDTVSRYPEFSDIRTSDFTINSLTPPHQARDFEDKYQYEQQRIPTYYGCRCKDCPLSYMFPRAPAPMRTHTIDERGQIDQRALLNAQCAQSAHSTQNAHSAQNAQGTLNTERMGNPTSIDISNANNAVLIMFLFLVIVFICGFYSSAINELREQLRAMEEKTGRY